MKRHALILLIAGLVAGTSFHCASPEFTTAKIALGQRDYPKALRNLELETRKNPGNVEAWLLLAQLYRDHKKDYAAAAEALRNARENDRAGSWRERIAAEELLLWMTAYNDAIVLYNQLVQVEQPLPQESLRRAQQLLELVVQLKPDVPDAYGLLGTLQELAGDTAAALKTFERYRELLQPELQVARRTGIALGMSREELLQRLGAPAASRVTASDADTLLVERWTVDGAPLYVFSIRTAGGATRVEGWRYNPPAVWSELEKERYTRLSLQPLLSAAIAALDRGEYERALSFADDILTLQPTNEQALSVRAEVYDRQGRTEELLRLLEQLRQQYPTNKVYHAQYGLLLTKLERYEEAIRAYEEALRLDPNYDLALFNAAAAYKNWAGKLQQEELEKRRQNPKYQEQRERYAPLLRKAAEYFERYRELPGKRDELTVLDQLVNIYEVLPDRQKLERIVRELEALAPRFEREARYYEILGGVYARRGDKTKAEEYYRKADQLRKQ